MVSLMGDPARLRRASRMAAKVGNATVQDGFTVDRHVFALTADGRVAVVQQGMDEAAGLARRDHWLGDGSTDFVDQPHAAVLGPPARREVLNLVAGGSGANRGAAVSLAQDGTAEVQPLLQRLEAGAYEPVARRCARARPIPQAGRIEKALRAL